MRKQKGSSPKKKYSLSEKAVYFLGKAVAYDNADRNRRNTGSTDVDKAVKELYRRVERMEGDDLKLTESFINGHDRTENALTAWLLSKRKPKK